MVKTDEKKKKKIRLSSILKRLYYIDFPRWTLPLRDFVSSNFIALKSVFITKRRKPRKVLLTPVGRLVERLSFGQIGGLIVLVVIASACFAHYYGVKSGNEIIKPAFPDALYFSVITFTSLGYGDLAPLGYGKAVAAVEVLVGLGLVAIFIGKIASERQSALLLLLYTSDQQQRISGFTNDLNKQNQDLNDAFQSAQGLEVTKNIQSALNFTSSICSYLILQANQGNLAEFGNFFSLRKLYRAFSGLLDTTFLILGSPTLLNSDQEQLKFIIIKISRTGLQMSRFHKKDKPTAKILSVLIKAEHRLLNMSSDNNI